MRATPAPEPAATTLVEAIARARDAKDACNVLLEHAVEVWGYRRAAVLVEVDEELSGVVQSGTGRVIEPLSMDPARLPPRLRRAIRGDAPAVVADQAGLSPLNFASFVVFPLVGPDGESVGAVIAEGDELDDDTERVADTCRRTGPAVARSVELDRLRTAARRANRDRELLTGMVDALPDPILLTDRDNQILTSNRRADELFVSGPADSEGRHRAVQVNNLFLSSRLTQAAMDEEGGRSGELNLVNPEDGTDLAFEVFTRPAAPDDGPAGAVYTVLRDITDLKTVVDELEEQIGRSRAAERRSRRESQRLEVILENVGEPILVTDQRSDIILMNREAEYLFEVPGDTPPEAAEARAIRANDTRFTSRMSEFLMQPRRRSSETVELEDPDEGEALPMRAVSTKIFDRHGEVNAVVSVLHDLRPFHEKERLARELRELNEELEERVEDATRELAQRNRELEEQRRELEKASRAKSEFLASISHELRTPINAMLGYTSLMEEGLYGELTERQYEALGKVRTASDQLLSLISDILDLSKIEADRLSVQVEEVDVEKIAADLGKTIKPMAREKDLELQVSVPDGLPPVRSDADKLRQVLLNLLSNAVKFTDEGRVTLRCCSEGGDRGATIRFQVEDTGVGIEEDQLEAIFEEFHQTARTAEDARGGVGLGLTISRKLVGLIGGTIRAESTPGEGSVFTIEIPSLLDADEPAGEPSAGG